MTISGFAAYVKQLWKNKPDTSTPLSAERLTHMEGGIKGNSDAIEKLAAAVVSQIANDPDKIASMAALYAVNEYAKSVNKRVDDTNSNLTGIVSANHNNVIQHNGLKVSSLYYIGYKNSPGGVDFEVELHQTYSYGIAIAMPCWEVLSPEEFSISFNGLSGSKAKFKVKGTKSPQICVVAVGK